jgi:glucose-6-phosphate 1-dehydrogenase
MPPHTAPDPCILVIFGASGDLTHRKLIPALFDLHKRRQLPGPFAVLGVSRSAMSDDQFREHLFSSLREHTRNAVERERDAWATFSRSIFYLAGDAVQPDVYPVLGQRLQAIASSPDFSAGGAANLLCYLSVAPQLYEPIIARLGESGLVTEGRRWCSINPDQMPWQRIIVEKPFGTDLASAVSLNKALGRVFEEEAIYRIDHYLGKELVQNILVLRFANSIFEPIWNRSHIDHVQVTAAETLGVGSRAATFYDQAGAMRDMVQSHLLQVLALVAIEPPSAFTADESMREKIKFFNAARPIPVERARDWAAFGRYGPGPGPDGRAEPAYVDERGVDPARKTETYAAIKVEFDTWRWAGVPFYLRSGKKLAKKLTEVVVQFKRPPTNLFRTLGYAPDQMPGNRLIINIAPNEGLTLLVHGKVPGTTGTTFGISTANLELDYLKQFGGEPVEAYGPLLLDAMRGDRTLYKHRDEVEGSWRICQPLLDSGELRDSIETHAPAAWGPRAADALLARDGRHWHNP